MRSKQRDEELTRLRARVHSTAVDPVIIANLINTAIEQREVNQAEQAKQAAQQAMIAQYTGGPCLYCGTTWTGDVLEGNNTKPTQGVWYPGPVCSFCNAESRDLGYADTVKLTDDEHRAKVVRDLLGPEETKFWYDGYLIERTGFKWWHETPGASPGGYQRFLYVDLAALRERLKPTTTGAKPQGYEKGEPCERCGCAYMWTMLPGEEQIVTDYVPNGTSGFMPMKRRVITDSARGCGGCWTYNNLGDVMERLVGLANLTPAFDTFKYNGIGPNPNLFTTRIGITWFKDRNPSNDRKNVTHVPFAYLDVDELKRKAFELFPYESRWRSKDTWQQLRMAARGSALVGGTV